MIDNFRPTVNYKPRSYNDSIYWRIPYDYHGDPIEYIVNSKIPDPTGYTLVSFQKSDTKVGYRVFYDDYRLTEPLWIDVVARDDGIQDVWWWTESGEYPLAEPFNVAQAFYGLPMYYLGLNGWEINFEGEDKLCVCIADGSLAPFPTESIDAVTIDLENCRITGYDENGYGICGSIDVESRYYLKNMTIESPKGLSNFFSDNTGIVDDIDMSGLTIENGGAFLNYEEANVFLNSGNGYDLNISNWTLPSDDGGVQLLDLGLDSGYYANVNASGWSVNGTETEIFFRQPIGGEYLDLSDWVVTQMNRLVVGSSGYDNDYNLDISGWNFNLSDDGYVTNPTRNPFIDINTNYYQNVNISNWRFNGCEDWSGYDTSHYESFLFDGVKNVLFRTEYYCDVDLSNWYVDDYTYVYNTRVISQHLANDVNISYFSPSARTFACCGYGTDGHGYETYDDGTQRNSVFYLENFNADVSDWNLSRTTSLQNCFLLNGEFYDNDYAITGLDTWDVSDIINFDRFINLVGNNFDYEAYSAYSEKEDFSEMTAWRDMLDNTASYYHILPPLYGVAEGSVPTGRKYPEWNGWFDIESTFYPYNNSVEDVDEIYYKGNVGTVYQFQTDILPSNDDDAATKALHPERYPVEVGDCYGVGIYAGSGGLSGYILSPAVYTTNGWVELNSDPEFGGTLTVTAIPSITTHDTASEILENVSGFVMDSETGTTTTFDCADDYCELTLPDPFETGWQQFDVKYVDTANNLYYTGYFVADVTQ